MENQLRSANPTRPSSAIALSRRSTFHQVIIKQGYLVKLPKCSKLGSSFKKPEKLWFVFGNLNRHIPFLDYYLNEEKIFSGVPDGSVEIRDCLYVLPSQKHPATTDPVFTIVLKDKRLSLATKTRTLMHEWCRAIEQNLRNLNILDSIGGNNVYSLVTINKSKPREEQESRERVQTPEIEPPNVPEIDNEEKSHDYENTRDNWDAAYISMSPRVYSNITHEDPGPPHSSLDSSNAENSPDEYILPNTPIRLIEPFSMMSYKGFGNDHSDDDDDDRLMTRGMDSPDVDEIRRNEILFSIESTNLYFTETVDRKTLKENKQDDRIVVNSPSTSNEVTIMKYEKYPQTTPADNTGGSINLLRKFPNGRTGVSQKSLSVIGCENCTNFPAGSINNRLTNLQRRTSNRNGTGIYPVPYGSGVYSVSNGAGLYPVPNGAGVYPGPNGAGVYPVPNETGVYPVPNNTTTSSSVLLTRQTILKNHMPDINLGSNMIVTTLRLTREIEINKPLELLICQSFKIHKLLNLVEAYNSLWIAGWNEQLMAKLFIPSNFFHLGDQLISVNDVEINTSTNYLKTFKKLKHLKKNFVRILRTPRAKVVLIKHKFDVLPSSTAMLFREVGLDVFGDHMQVKNICPGGIVSQCDLPVKAPNLKGENVCDWCVTEINHRHVGSFSEDGKVEEVLKLREPFTSLLLQPSDLVLKLK